MKGVFRFWGYGRDAWEGLAGTRLVGAEAGAAPLETAFGRLRFAGAGRDLLGGFAADLDDAPYAYVRHRPGPAPSGAVLAWLDGDAGELPLLSLEDGRFRFHFDVDESIDFVQQERYFVTRPPVYVRLGIAPENLPAGVRWLVLKAFTGSRRVLRAVRPSAPFPKTYKDFSVDVWRFAVRAMVETAPMPPPGKPLWPHGKDYAVVLNHDVDSRWGIEAAAGIAAFRAVEEGLGLRSAWMVVADLYGVGRACFEELRAAGHEIGCHGARHDHATAYLPVERIRERLAEARPFLDAFACTGFRAPSYHRTEALYEALEGLVGYDMSMHDCFENANSPVPSFEGCATCFPFRVAGTRILEIPTTVAEDFVLELAGQSASQARQTQGAIVAAIRRRQGVANILTHPEPQLSARRPWLDCYAGLLEDLAGDQSAWFALPGEVAAWWNRRQAEIDARW